MFRFVAAVAALSLALVASTAQAQSFRPDPAAPTSMALGDDYEIQVTPGFGLRLGGTTHTQILLGSNAGFRTLDVLGAFPGFVDDLDIRAGVGTATYGTTSVGGRSAFVASFRNVGYSPTRGAGSLPSDRGSVQLVLIDRSDIAAGDFDLEINGEGLAYPSSSQSIRINGGSAGRAGVGVIPAGPGAYRLLWNFRSGALASGVGPLLVPVLSFTSTPSSSAATGGMYAVTTTSTSTEPVTFSVTPASAGVCTVAGATVSLTGGGTCTVVASQSAGGGFAATQAEQSFAVAAPAPVPTMTEWAMILFGTILAGAAALMVTRQRLT
ncbi:IPTL-CTERM sorting domain-containing protein [Brevundimonas staleyi]|uniref:IPTL-CTERM sorting domain-containing protein n=1 Tax=Brevundimonas staleyi TaxID=74326 RepID=A0ABW0FY76_9CAUL